MKVANWRSFDAPDQSPQIPSFHPLLTVASDTLTPAVTDLIYNLSRSARHNGTSRNSHAGRNNGAGQYPAAFFDNAKRRQHTVGTDVHVARNRGRRNMRIRSDENIVAYPHRKVLHLAFAESNRRADRGVRCNYRRSESATSLAVIRDDALSPVLSYFPILIAVFGVFSFSPAAIGSGFRHRSPRRCTPAMMTVLPPSMIFCFPSIIALLEILLPVSLKHLRNGASKVQGCDTSIRRV